MKIYISVDMEGISGVTHKSSLGPGSSDYELAKKAMTEDVNAAIEGAIEAGANEIVVNDSHGMMRNLILERVRTEAKVIQGYTKKLSMMEGIDYTYDAVIFIGYHVRANNKGVMSHTLNGYAFSSVYMNEKETGETAINAAIAGYFGVPVVMISGDDCLKREVEDILPDVEYAQVKETCGQMSAKCLHPHLARELIKEKVKIALKNLSKHKPYSLDKPVNLKVVLGNAMIADLVESIPKVERISGNCVRYQAENPLEVMGILTAMSNISLALFMDK